MKLVVFGLTVSSSWGNGHATLWRGLCRALAARSHRVVFFEKDTSYYRANRDLEELERGRLVLYSDFDSVRSLAEREVRDADAAMVTSYCPDGEVASRMVLDMARGARVFYDLDTPVTLAALESGVQPPYVHRGGLSGFDLVLSFTGGRALNLLRERLGARRVAPLYGHVDPLLHRPVAPSPEYRSDLSYLGTYAEDRQSALEELFLGAARAQPDRVFALAGSLYPHPHRFSNNVLYHGHLPPGEHATFFCSSRVTLNLTRSTMSRLGFCPSGRLFEAAASGVPIVSDWFEGLDHFFEPGREIRVVRNRSEVLSALDDSDHELKRTAARARERVLDQHTAARRAEELLNLLGSLDRVPDAIGAENRP